MIKSVTITNYLGDSVKIELDEDNPDHGLIIRKIDGLGPAKANINTTDLATNDGSIYNSSRLNQRNIVFGLLFTFAPKIEDARQNTYKYFPIKKNLEIVIETDNRTVRTIGYVETNEPDVFNKQEGSQISIICTDPYFYSAGENGIVSTVFYGIEPLFEFVFDNNSLDDNLIEFGSIENEQEKNVYYEGDGEVGITIYIHALGEARNITIYNTGTREVVYINTERIKELTGSGIVAGDDIIISTVRGNKSVKLLRAGVYTNILNCLEKGSDWFTLTRGDNIFAYIAEYGSENLEFRIENRILYEGV